MSTLATMRPDTKAAVMALSILIDRIGQLPTTDRNSLFELLQEWRTVTDEAERMIIESAMQEIIACPDVTATRIDPTPPPLEGGRKAWAIHIGKQIRMVREQRGLTQTVLAENSGIPQSHLSRLENGEHSANRATLEKIARALDMNLVQWDPNASEE